MAMCVPATVIQKPHKGFASIPFPDLPMPKKLSQPRTLRPQKPVAPVPTPVPVKPVPVIRPIPSMAQLGVEEEVQYPAAKPVITESEEAVSMGNYTVEPIKIDDYNG